MSNLIINLAKSIEKNELKFFRRMMKRIAKAKARGEQA